VLKHTGSGHVIGHSSGGFIALQAALRLPIDRLALYDAAVSIDGSFPSGWLDGARAAARSGDTARAMALTSAGINTHMAAAKLPLGVQTAFCRLFLRTSIGRTAATTRSTGPLADSSSPSRRSSPADSEPPR
jgi:pimeloyl-ACP methyl ester carboxylesterase